MSGIQVLNTSGNISGRLGSALGQGLSDAIPKIMERKMLSSGLKQLGENAGNKTPLEIATEAYGIPGITPEMVRQFGQLAQQQQMRDAYGRRAGSQAKGQQLPGQQGDRFGDIDFANMPKGQSRKEVDGLKQTPSFSGEAGQPQINPKNPVREEVIPRKPWNQEKRNEILSRNFDQIPGLTLQENLAMTSEEEQRELSQPIAAQQQDEFLRQSAERIDKKFEEKSKFLIGDSFKNINAEMFDGLKNGLKRDLAANPNLSEDDAINDWSRRANELQKTKTALETNAKTTGMFNVLLDNKKELDKLAQYQKIYAEAGNSEEYWNSLQKDYGFSKGAAAQIAYPVNNRISEYVKQNVKSPSLSDPKFIKSISKDNQYAESIKVAQDLIDKHLITPKDSLIAIVRKVRQKNNLFNAGAFIEYLKASQDQMGLTSFQKRELAENENLLSNWSDLLYLGN